MRRMVQLLTGNNLLVASLQARIEEDSLKGPIESSTRDCCSAVQDSQSSSQGTNLVLPCDLTPQYIDFLAAVQVWAHPQRHSNCRFAHNQEGCAFFFLSSCFIEMHIVE
eukprot:scaffold319_cov362-Pavlova_lutheri.AAC.27